MIYRHERHPARAVRLAYCQNVHASERVSEVEAGFERVTAPLRDRLAPHGAFGVGLYLPAATARELASSSGACDAFARRLARERFDPFTWNAFPYERFHVDGLKSDVFRPAWDEPARLDFTRDVARVAAACARACEAHTRATPDSAFGSTNPHRRPPSDATAGNDTSDRAVRATARSDANDSASGRHVSISTHTGAFGSWVRGLDDVDAYAAAMARAVRELARLEDETGVRIVLSLEPEPRANAGNARELATFLARARDVATRGTTAVADALVARHLGYCFDTCHAAIEGDDDPLATLAGVVLGKVQYSNALVVRDPARHPESVAAMLSLAEPRYLHQVRGHGAGVELSVADLPELRAELSGARAASWMSCREWRCHFHVPVDLERAEGGLTTTRAHADRALGALLDDPARWTTAELHVEIETYTWDILSGALRGGGDLVDGLEREYRHVQGLLERAGWRADAPKSR